MNYLLQKIIRSFRQDRKNLVIKLSGLVLGTVSAILMLQYVTFEHSFDRFNSDCENILRTTNTKSVAIGPLSKELLPNVEDFVRLHPAYRGIQISIEDIAFSEENVFYADGSLFSAFSFPVLRGNAEKALSTKNNLIISESYARKYFGDENPIGKELRLQGAYENNTSYTVGAVYNDLPQNSHLQSNIFLSIENILAHRMYKDENQWKWRNFFTYFLVNERTNAKELGQAIQKIAIQNGEESFRKETPIYDLIPLKHIHLKGEQNFSDNNFSASNVYLWIIIAIAILIMVWVNTINISIAQLVKNQKSVGVKKLLGATKLSFFTEQFTQFIVLNFLALIISIILSIVVSPLMQKWLGLTISVPKGYGLIFWSSILLLFVLGSFVLAVLTNLSTVKINILNLLANNKKRNMKKSVSPQSILLVTQFSISIVLICFSLFSWKQVKDLINADKGIETNKVLAIRSAQTSNNEIPVKKAKAVFESEVQKISGVEAASSLVYLPGSYIPSNMSTKLLNTKEDNEIDTRMNWTGYDYFKILNHKIIAGRTFSKDFSTDNKGVVINESLAKKYGFDNAEDVVGKDISWVTRNQNRKIIGVIEDFKQLSAENIIEPMMFHLWENTRGYCIVQLTNDNIGNTFSEIEKLWHKTHTGNPFEFVWLDAHYNTQFSKWQQFSRMTSVFSIISIIIACLGLFGIMSFILAQRFKEIGIRKVNGATVNDILIMLNIRYAILVLFAIIIALPVTWYTTNKWLESFEYKTELSFWVFVFTGLCVILASGLTVTLKALKTVRRNPVEALKYE